jgi:hypothetical protein
VRRTCATSSPSNDVTAHIGDFAQLDLVAQQLGTRTDRHSRTRRIDVEHVATLADCDPDPASLTHGEPGDSTVVSDHRA